ncbi:hypothetical protein [Thermus thermophilus HB8]|uniref:Uncharacterized protein n=1 Tax=Thermus thermophilus (strain ATCC 27634 / DSM 579 / HB8) TaxID=300852 RepID=Q5SJU0_THET8|nr:hypothetical protein [Thermus thermophilus HB8]
MGLLLLRSQSPYGAQSLATLNFSGRWACPFLKVAIPLRGSIPCNVANLHELQKALEGQSRNPLTGLNPLQPVASA